MSTWKIRHEGSPRAVEGLSLAQVLEGLQDGRWEGTDEVMGPHDRDWVAIENHPQFADVAAELEQPPPKHYDDETRLDMNALIDVTLVLLIFFIITTTYAALQKRLDAPNPTASTQDLPVVTVEQAEEQMVLVTVRMENGVPVTRIEKDIVPPERLEADLRAHTKIKTDILLDHDDNVPEGAIVKVLDAARGAGIAHIRLVVPEKK